VKRTLGVLLFVVPLINRAPFGTLSTFGPTVCPQVSRSFDLTTSPIQHKLLVLHPHPPHSELDSI